MTNPQPVPKREVDVIIQKLGGLPPVEYSLMWTEDQQAHWQKIRADYLTLRDELKAYFSGQPSSLTHLPQDEREKFEAWRDDSLAFYDVLRAGWFYLQSAGLNREVTSPGELLITLLENESLGQLVPCVSGRIDLNPRKLSETKGKTAKLNPGDPADEEKAQQILKDYRRLMKDFLPFSEGLRHCLEVCRAAAKHDKTLRRKLAIFHEANSRLQKIMYRGYRGMGAIAWEKGRKLKAGRGGGYK